MYSKEETLNASFFKRLLALIVDNFLVTIILFVFMFSSFSEQVLNILNESPMKDIIFNDDNTFNLEALSNTQLDEATIKNLKKVMLFMTICFSIVRIIYEVVFWSKFKATPGQLFMRISLVDDSYKSPKFSYLLYRSILRIFLNIYSLVYLISCVWILFDKKKQTLHDKFCKMYVVDTKVFNEVKKDLKSEEEYSYLD